MAQTPSWLACKPDYSLSDERREEIQKIRHNLAVNDGLETGTTIPVSRIHSRSMKGPFGSGLPDPGRKIGGDPQPQSMVGSRGCIGSRLPMNGSALILRHAAANLGGESTRDHHRPPENLKRKASSSTDEGPDTKSMRGTPRSSSNTERPNGWPLSVQSSSGKPKHLHVVPELPKVSVKFKLMPNGKLSKAVVPDDHDNTKRAASSSNPSAGSSAAEANDMQNRQDSFPSFGNVGPSGNCLLWADDPDKIMVEKWPVACTLKGYPSRMSRHECWPTGWTIGAQFKFRHNTHHRVYEGPPDGTPRVRLGAEEVFIDFNRVFRVTGMFANSLFSAVSFRVPNLDDVAGGVYKARGGNDPESDVDDVYEVKRPGSLPTTVWTNVRRNTVWWAKLVCTDASDDENDEWGPTLPS